MCGRDQNDVTNRLRPWDRVLQLIPEQDQAEQGLTPSVALVYDQTNSERSEVLIRLN